MTKRKIIITLILTVGIILSQVYFPLLNIYGADDESVDSNVTINSINKFNNYEDIINSHEGDIENSSLEVNSRDKIIVDFSKFINNNIELKNIVYPRLKKLSKETDDGYKYLLTFQSCCIDENGSVTSNNGKNVYYTRSKDLKVWDEPKVLYQSSLISRTYTSTDGSQTKLEKTFNFSSCDTYVLNDGRIMAVASRYGENTFRYPMDLFKECGIYVSYCDPYDKDSTGSWKWSQPQKIYSGMTWEPSILQLDTGEIHIYFTHSAHVQYMDGYYSSIYGWIANLSAQSQSGSVAMISSIDNGKSWTPDVQGAESNKIYNANERNPYSAYRIAQQTTKKAGSSDTANFKNLYYWSTSGNTWQRHLGINTDDKTIIKMTDQMPVAIKLNKKNKIVMAMESSLITGKEITGEDVGTTDAEKLAFDDLTDDAAKISIINSSSALKTSSFINNHTVKYTHDISLAYSDMINVSVKNNNKEEIVGKYWLDINNNSMDKYESQRQIYDSEGLGITQEGPINRISNMHRGAAPYIRQFPSGETVLSYGVSPKSILKLGNTEGEFNNSNIVTLEYGTWNSLELLSSHCMALTISRFNKDTNIREIVINPVYLNHTISATRKDLTTRNDDALFIGSDSQAQMTLRASFDDDNIYFAIDRLDKSITQSTETDDTIELYFSTDNLVYQNNRYNYCKIKISRNGVEEFRLYDSSNNFIDADNINLKCKIDTKAINDESGGYRVNLIMPREMLATSNNIIRANAILNNKDEIENGYSDVTSDTFENISMNDVNTWKKIDLSDKEKYIDIKADKINPTNTSVNISISKVESLASLDNYNIEYCIKDFDQNIISDYTEYTKPFTVENNCIVMARLKSQNGKTIGEVLYYVINIDKVPPRTLHTAISSVTQDSFKLDIKGKDNESGISKIRVYVNNELKKTYEYKEDINAEKQEVFIPSEKLTQNTKYTYYVEVEDVAGNITSTKGKTDDETPFITTSIIQTLDATISYNPTTWTKEKVLVTVSQKNIIEEGLKLQYMLVKDDGTVIKDYTDYTGPFEVNENVMIKARITDGINVSNEKTENIINIDKVKPSVAVVNATDITSKSFRLNISGKDNESGISKIRVYIDNKLRKTYSYDTDLNSEKQEVLNVNNLNQNTKYSAYVEVEDVAGNISSTNYSELNILTNSATNSDIVNTSDEIHFVIIILGFVVLINLFNTLVKMKIKN